MMTVQDWYRGEPAARAAGIEALQALDAFRPGSTDVRAAVRLVQKRWGHDPTGTLSPAEWDRLLAVGDPSRVAEDDGSEPSPASTHDGSEPSPPGQHDD